MPRPLLWGEVEVVRELLKDLAGSVDIQPRTVTLRFGSVQAVLDFHERFNGPLIALQSTLPPRRYQALLGELAELTEEFNQASDGSVRIESAYLLVVARKP